MVPATLSLRCPFVEILDPKWVDEATVFVSHAYSYRVADSFEVMLRYEESHGGSYYWFDPFSLNQHSDGGVVETEVLEQAFGESIRAIGATLIVSSPWDNPCFLNRAWCLFELMSSVNVGVPVEIVLPRAEEVLFVNALREDWKVVYKALAEIDSRKAQAKEAKDLEAIHRAVERSVTHAGLNKLVNQQLREWLIEMAKKELLRLAQCGDESELSEFQLSASVMMLQLGHLVEGEEVARACVELTDRLFGIQDSKALRAASRLGSILQAQGKLSEAEPLYQRALAGREETLGPNHPDTLASVNNLAVLLKAQGKLSEAEPLYQRALAGREETLGPNHPQTLTSVNNLAGLLQAQGKLSEAEPLYQRALTGCEETLGPNHPQTLASVDNLAVLLKAQGKLSEAEPRSLPSCS